MIIVKQLTRYTYITFLYICILHIFIHISNYIVKNATGRVILFKHLLIL